MRSCFLLVLLTACSLDEPDDELDFSTDAALVGTPDAPAPAPGRVTFGRDTSERIYGVRIRDRAHEQPKVVYSVRLADVQADQQLLLRGEVTLSRCNRKDVLGLSGDSKHTPCDSGDMRRDPYNYAPRFSAAFMLGNSPTDAGGKRVSDWFERRCTEGQHHCALALSQVRVDNLGNHAELYVNLVVTADAVDRNARCWHVMEVEQHKGALAVTRLGAGAGGVAIAEDTNNLLATGRMGVDRPKEDGDPTQVRHRLFRVALTGLQGGEVVDVDARMRAVLVGTYSCDPLITTEVIITGDPQAKKPSGNHDKSITIKNGANCADHSNDGCGYDESGAVQLDNNTPSTMYVSMLAVALRSCADAGGGDRWKVDGGALHVTARR